MNFYRLAVVVGVGRRQETPVEELYASARTPEMTMLDDQFSMASRLRKSHSVDASYLDDDDANDDREEGRDEDTSLNEAVNSKMMCSRSFISTRSKSKSDYNLAFQSSSRSGISIQTETFNKSLSVSLESNQNDSIEIQILLLNY